VGVIDDLSSLELAATSDGVGFALRVRPSSRADAVLGVHGGALRIAVRAAPEKGRANEAVIDLLARVLAVPRAAVRITSGAGGRDKRVVVAGTALETLRARLSEALTRSR
jgi:hypothetical protein